MVGKQNNKTNAQNVVKQNSYGQLVENNLLEVAFAKSNLFPIYGAYIL
jgi:hypothetical protein